MSPHELIRLKLPCPLFVIRGAVSPSYPAPLGPSSVAGGSVYTGSMKKSVVVAVSGGFDPVHIGHIRMFKEARALGDKLVVILNNDHWLVDKKGFAFMPEAERKEVLEAIEAIDEVLLTDHIPGDGDRSVCRGLRQIRPDIFANGGDRKPDGDPVPEVALCEEFGIEMLYNVGQGGKVQSSSWLTKRVRESDAT